MATIRLFVLVFVALGLLGCKPSAQDERAKALVSEANTLFAKSSKLTSQWTNEYLKAFTQENRAKFPANRDWLSAEAEKITTILDECSRMDHTMIQKYEEASALSTKDQDRKGISSLAAAIRKDLEVTELVKSQMRLVSDEQIKDAKTLNEKLMSSWQLIQQKQSESTDLIKEGRRLLVAQQ
jgi:hypothetical protein